MPYSDLFNRKPVLDFVSSKINNKKKFRVLDLGAGLGLFGELLRKKFKNNLWIDGVEVWKKYKNFLWKNYDKVYEENIEDFLLKNKKKYDLILLIDVIEHFDKAKGFKIINLIKKYGDSILVSTPITYFPQGEAFKNPYETHKSLWSKKELEKEGFKLIKSKRVLQDLTKIFQFKNCPLSAELGVFSYEKPKKAGP
ncbi:Ubiquinone biosynthesis O-methyltransferase [Candidatus Tiddalikarchaeum anstoanum]|nr:Ubiquinone biosynthesis O-methyltransferase [Candidatus Tiddalikarchaeum anstoanum]